MFHDLISFQDSGMSSDVGLQDYKITSLFEDLANMNKNLSILAGLNSHAGNGQEQHERVQSTHNNTQALTLLDIKIPDLTISPDAFFYGFFGKTPDISRNGL